jgi:exopolysaccharide biosynthesis predicted pyruvyltransferase EpsI
VTVEGWRLSAGVHSPSGISGERLHFTQVLLGSGHTVVTGRLHAHVLSLLLGFWETWTNV